LLIILFSSQSTV